jgi:hypothetical protein
MAMVIPVDREFPLDVILGKSPSDIKRVSVGNMGIASLAAKAIRYKKVKNEIDQEA